VKLRAVHAGGYPRIGDAREQQKLRLAQAAFDRGDIPEDKLVDAQNDMVRGVLSEQAKAGMDLVSDGQIRWYDAVSHMMRKIEGVKIGGLLRYYDTNTYFRQPQVVGPISSKGPLIADEFKFARAISPRPVTATITGPFTLSRLAIPGGPCREADQVMKALVPILADEIGQLASAGADNIVVEEHFLLREPGGLFQVEDALEVLGGRKGPAKLWLRLSFGDSSPLYGKLQKLPVDGLVLDFTYSGRLAEIVSTDGSDLPLGLGLVDARNTRMENPAKLAREAERLVRRVRGSESWLIASNGLEYLSRPRAAEKLAVLARARDLLAGKGGGRVKSRRKAKPAGKRKPARKPVRQVKLSGKARKPSARKRPLRKPARRSHPPVVRQPARLRRPVVKKPARHIRPPVARKLGKRPARREARRGRR